MTVGAFAAEVLLLGVIGATTGLGVVGWVVGVACGATVNVLLVRGLDREARASVSPAHGVTLVRSMIVGAVAAMVADSWARPVQVPLLVGLSALALSLDAVDGWVARRTGTVTPLGARFDMEVDAFLILVLSVFVYRTFGPWVLAIGLARYVYVAAGWLWPWLREVPPERHWRKTVAAIQGVVLTTAAAHLLPTPVVVIALVVALALLAESFGRDVWWLRQRRRGQDPSPVPPARTVLRWSITGGAAVVIWAALALPSQISDLAPSAFVRLPIEVLVVVALAVVLPSRVRAVLAWVFGVLLAILAVLKTLDLGFSAVLYRPFNPVVDLGALGSAAGVVRDSVGPLWAAVAEVAGVLLVRALLVVIPLTAVRLVRFRARHRRGAVRTVATAGVVWVVCAAAGLGTAGGRVAATDASVLAYQQARQVAETVRDQRAFARALVADDPMARTATDDLLTGLRGKDVIIVVVESYGRVAVQGSSISPGVVAALETDTAALRAAGFHARSGFLTSPTFGGISWLAHSTLQSGMWVDSQQRYDQLVSSHRFTLSDAFKRAGWRTVVDIPSNTRDWPEGESFYHYDQIYDARNVGYAGPRFSYAAVPDQYTLSAFQRRELAQPGHPPVMAEIDLVSSHTPWAPLPRLVDWDALGDGSIFDPMPAQGRSPSVVWRDAKQVQAAYGRSIEYAMGAITSFVENAHDDNLVLVVYGDHQPAQTVSGPGASHDVPISVIARDPKVLGSISSWGWQDGLRPDPHATAWPMDRFRDRFLTAFGRP
jgi:phosphatidylglycerophosphate synthase